MVGMLPGVWRLRLAWLTRFLKVGRLKVGGTSLLWEFCYGKYLGCTRFVFQIFLGDWFSNVYKPTLGIHWNNFLGVGPLPVTVTTRITTCLVGNSCKKKTSFAKGILRGGKNPPCVVWTFATCRAWNGAKGTWKWILDTQSIYHDISWIYLIYSNIYIHIDYIRSYISYGIMVVIYI